MVLQFERDLRHALIDRVEALRVYVEMKIPERLKFTIPADDILQEVWVAAHAGIADFQPDGPNALDRWLLTITNNRLIDAFRAARTIKRGGETRCVRDAHRRMHSFCTLFARLRSPGKTPSREVRQFEAARAIELSLACLPSERRRVIELRFVDGLSCREIADQLGKSERAVNSLLFHGLRQLRTLVGDADEFLSK
jgi:RNA polymerase sigma-70 factor (ECF subfamily)